MAKRGRPRKNATATKRPRQPKLPAMEDVSIAEIDDAAADYVEFRDMRMENLRLEVECGNKLLELMKKHGTEYYEFNGQVVYVRSKTKVQVKRSKDSDESEE